MAQSGRINNNYKVETPRIDSQSNAHEYKHNPGEYGTNDAHNTNDIDEPTEHLATAEQPDKNGYIHNAHSKCALVNACASGRTSTGRDTTNHTTTGYKSRKLAGSHQSGSHKRSCCGISQYEFGK